MSAPEVTRIDDRQVIHLTYSEADYPGWKPGEILHGDLRAPDGPVYRFSGVATVAGVVFNAGRQYDIQISHLPPNEDRGI